MRISDWSSDVCSSDPGVATLYNYFGSLAEVNDALAIVLLNEIPLFDAKNARETRRQLKEIVMAYAKVVARHPDFERMVGPLADQQILRLQIGRASCRERVCQ